MGDEPVRQLAAPVGDGVPPSLEVGPLEQVGQDREGQTVQRPRRLGGDEALRVVGQHVADAQPRAREELGERSDHHRALVAAGPLARGQRVERSEEHTSELQSLMRISYAGFCLKKQKINNEVDETSTMAT